MTFLTGQMALVVKNLPANAGDTRDMSLSPGLGRTPGEGNGNSLQYSCMRNSKDRGTWWAAVHGVSKPRGLVLVTKQQLGTLLTVLLVTLEFFSVT